jgi:hypothetical protein
MTPLLPTVNGAHEQQKTAAHRNNFEKNPDRATILTDNLAT